MSNDILQNKLSSASEINLSKLEIVTQSGLSVDVSTFFVSLELYESMFSNTITGSVTIHDKNNLLGNTAINGKEKINVVFNTPSAPEISKTFYVHEISLNQRIPGKKESMIKINFSTLPFFLSYSQKISKSYKNKSISQIALSIFFDYLSNKNDRLEYVITSIPDTGPKTSVVIPRWTPFQTLNWLAKKAEKNGNCDYMFFESMEGFFFAPLSFFKSQIPVTTYKYVEEKVTDGLSKNIDLEISKIMTFVDISDIDKKSQLEMEGVFASRMLVHDTTFKSIEANNFSYLKDLGDSEIITLEKNLIAPFSYIDKVSPTVKYMHKCKSEYSFDGVKEQSSPFNHQKRLSHLLRNNTKVLRLDVPGDSRRRVGDVINVEILSPEYIGAKDDTDILDKYLSGRYLISSIGHHIVRNDGYFMGLEVMKDSQYSPVSDLVSIG